MPLTSVYDYTDKLKELLGKDGKVKDISSEFKEIADNSGRIAFVGRLLHEYGLTIDSQKLKLGKSDVIAEACRSKGNQFYKEKQFLDALEAYNKSLCFAEPGSKTVALALSNRSAVYFEMKLYESCLNNISLHGKMNHDDISKETLEKLDKRRVLCIEALNAKKTIPKEERPVDPIGSEFLRMTLKPNKKLPYIADCLELKCDDKFGRYITTKELLKPGDVVAVEEPFSKLLLSTHRYKYCVNCLRDNFLDLIACSDCTSAMFCSEKCKVEANHNFHKYECPIIDKLNSVATKILRIAVKTFFEALHVCGGNLDELKALIEENRDSCVTIFDFEGELTPKNVLQAVDALETNEQFRTKADLFQRSGTVSIICQLFLQHTPLRELLVTPEDRDFFRCFVMKQTQLAACNYHGLYNGVVKKSEIESNPQYGSGSFPFCSMMNHSCAPNLVRVASGGRNFVVINRPIKPGEQLFDNYGFHHCLEDLKERQATLLSQYMFKCECEACIKNFKLFPYLPTYDKNVNQFLSDDLKKLSQMDVQRAKERFKAYCDYIAKADKNYPCWEVSSIQECLNRCFTIFTMSEFKLKLCSQ